MSEKNKTTKDENFEKAALLVAVLLGMTYKTYEELAANPDDLNKVVAKMHGSDGLMDNIMQDKELSDKSLKKMAIEATQPSSNFKRVKTSGQANVCDSCRPWHGKIICLDGSDDKFPSLDDYINSGAFHPNCRCSLEDIDDTSMNNSTLNSRPTMNEIEILDNGESEVQVATVGKVVGSDINGKPVEQNFTEEALKKVADTQRDDILVDADHSSETGGSTEAKGWLHSLFVKPGVGLFGKIKWTDIGRKLIENRVFRWLSPAWQLNENKEPECMTSCALTNKPAQEGRICPIVNSKPAGEDNKDDNNNN